MLSIDINKSRDELLAIVEVASNIKKGGYRYSMHMGTINTSNPTFTSINSLHR